MRAFALVSLALAGLARAALPDNASDLPLSHLLKLAQDSLAQGKSIDALDLYDHCLERDPSDFATLYKRATVRLATGHLAKAKDGFVDVLAVRDYDLAHLQLAKIHAKLAEYDEARGEVDTFLRSASKDKGNHDKEVKEAEELRKQVVAAQKEYLAAQKALARSPPNLDRCLSSSSSAILTSPQSLSLRLLRAECALLAHDFDAAIGDLSRASALSPTLPQHLLVRIALLSALFTDNGLAIPFETHASLKRCLAADPDSKTCAKPLKNLKKLEKELAQLRNWVDAGRWTEAAVTIAGGASREGLLPSVKSLLETYQEPIARGAPADEAPLPRAAGDAHLAHKSPLLQHLTSTLCRAYVSLDSRKAASACREALAFDPEDTWGLVGRGDELLKREEYDEAVRVLSAAFEATGRSDRKVLERLQKAQRLLKQSKSKDYYKILGVARDADDKTIKRAYRKATLKAHPDKEGGSEEKMAALNEAYEVISNPELRARFDAGEDPNDPHSGHGGFGGHGGNPFGGGGAGGQPIFFQQGGSPFGGGGGGGGAFQQFFQQQAGGGGGQQFQFRWG
ncbi:Co-chaperone [Rhodotorula diobovata]|uniref:Co-chaperone n=1 Tax=Rhodotorula diobovata TaxID=5288 RepID=A0A5C5FLH0_9BASI|nr:Co-chaperone [Rhodotorula diobovata]